LNYILLDVFNILGGLAVFDEMPPNCIHYNNFITSPPKVIWEELHCHPSQQRMDSPAACAN